MVGYTHERIGDSDDGVSLSVQDDEDVVGNPDSSTFQVEESTPDINTFEVDLYSVTSPNKTVDVTNKLLGVPPLGYLQDCGVGMTPYSKKQLENILEVVLVGYTKHGRSHQYKVSSWVLDLENTVAQYDGTTVSLPIHVQISRESKNRLTSSHERRVIVSTKKHNANLQNMGVIWEIVENNLHATTNPTMRASTCQF